MEPKVAARSSIRQAGSFPISDDRSFASVEPLNPADHRWPLFDRDPGRYTLEIDDIAGPLQAASSWTPPQQVIDSTPAEAWRGVTAKNMMVMQLASGGQFVLQLAPTFAPVHVANIRALVRAGWFDGGAIVRGQDAHGVQWAARELPGRPLLAGVVATPPPE